MEIGSANNQVFYEGNLEYIDFYFSNLFLLFIDDSGNQYYETIADEDLSLTLIGENESGPLKIAWMRRLVVCS